MEYTYSNYEKYLYSCNIDACKKCGIYLLEKIIKSYPLNAKLKTDLTNLISKLNSLEATDDYCTELLFEVKRTLYSYPRE